MSLGLKKSDLDYIVAKIGEFTEVERAVIFGSRAKGNYKPGSDIDIAIMGEDVNLDTLSKLTYLLGEQGPLPYEVDIVDYTHLKHQELKEHINRMGKEIYRK